MSCQAGPGIEPGPSALKASALPIELTWQMYNINLYFFTIVLERVTFICFGHTIFLIVVKLYDFHLKHIGN